MGRALCSWVGGHADVVAFLDNHRMPEKKDGIERIGEKAVLTISSSPVRAEVGHLGRHGEWTWKVQCKWTGVPCQVTFRT